MENSVNWYATLIKPNWAPPSWLFGPVWTVLYIVIALTFGFIFYKVVTRKLPWGIAAPFALNLAFNFAFTPIQFGLKNNFLAAVDIVLVLATLAWAMTKIYPYNKWIVYSNIPYLCWVIFATILQFSITFLNI